MTRFDGTWSGLRAWWEHCGRKERPVRERWAKLSGWKPLGDHPTDGTWFLVRKGDRLPYLAQVDDKDRWWAQEAGDIWPMKPDEVTLWRAWDDSD